MVNGKVLRNDHCKGEFDKMILGTVEMVPSSLDLDSFSLLVSELNSYRRYPSEPAAAGCKQFIALPANHICSLVTMLLNPPAAAQCHSQNSNRQLPGPTRVSNRINSARCRQGSSRPAFAVNTAQVVEQETITHSPDQTEHLTSSHSESGPKSSDMSSKPQIPRNKVLTTSMIAHATNKDVDQVRHTRN